MRHKPWDAKAAAWLIAPFKDSNTIHPNHFTLLRLVVGLAGAWLFAKGTYLNTAAVLIISSNFIDHMDGELARLADKQSRFGHIFDLASDALVTVLMFVGIGVGVALSPETNYALEAGVISGVSVALIFHLRYLIEEKHGKSKIDQAFWGGFEAEDILYLIPIVTLLEGLNYFLYLASLGAPLAAAFVVFQYGKIMVEEK
ncbi:MAG: CDP-alcohol phosphatidyltransferase family protein [Proteobacteria bacterium]|nr:CDP-alcohol phosphatidyltransferase family protein [Pseudomonadota bacterium]MBT5064817.1 CDP-alcohol phosphatidyltransferase family protein [Pseudomonadota bacterium]MBT6193649.1 CDP-alcohol phosphatidyltransferase family protein [Pseudomonadota bacterium]MBT6464380.1 CDP-alcohol phosphatidyltransferase family protein [Pseudomonadota bacterium]MBT6673962.1 CDP-alcohol phosphatidyltransferase family protein [Pseudomonadota bacterium]